MTTPIVLFLAFGAFFGLATHAHRHLFSEGPTTRGAGGSKDPMDGRLAWTVICCFLWPIMALTGLHSVLLLARRRAVAARRPRD